METIEFMIPSESPPLNGLELVEYLERDGNLMLDSDPLIQFDDETMPVSAMSTPMSNQYPESFPPSLPAPEPSGPYPPRPGPPEQAVFPGQYNFTAKLCQSTATEKNTKYAYSAQEKKMYAKMDVDFAVEFNWIDTNCRAMYVRACVVFRDSEHAEQRVQCCLQHRKPNLPEHIQLNVVRSSRALGTSGVVYHGQPERADSWLSVLVEFAPDAVRTHAYRFACKNSCSTGINRRRTNLVFTLEDYTGTVLGRDALECRMCSCPTRDMRKDLGTERPAPAKRVLAPHAAPRGKKVKVEAPSPQQYPVLTLPPLEVVGANTLVAGLEVMARVMEPMLEHPQHAAAVAERLAALREQIHRLKAEHMIA